MTTLPIMQTHQDSACALCALPLSKHAIAEDERFFCCPGCHAVYNILRAKNELGNYRATSTFQQAVQAGLVSNAALLDELKTASTKEDEPQEERHKLQLEIPDLWCPSCAEVIRWAVLRQKGVTLCVVDYCTDLAVIEYLPKKISKDKVMATIQALGYHPQRLDNVGHSKVSGWLYLRFFFAAFFALNIMMLSYPIYASYWNQESLGWTQMFAWISGLLATPVLLFSAWPLFIRAFHAARAGALGMEALVTIAISSAYIYSLAILIQGGTHVYFDSLSVVVAFVLLGRMIENRAKFRAKETLIQLSRSRIRRVRKVISEDKVEFILLKEVQVGDRLIAVTGETIALEGTVTEGEAWINTSSVTGEPIPEHKKAGSEVLSGTTVMQGRIIYRAAATEDKSLLQQIFQAIEQDLSHKSSYVRAADQVAVYFVPIVLAFALIVVCWLVALGATWDSILLRVMAILLISCPCAIGIAAPLVESLTLGRLASKGVLIRNRACLQYLGRESDFLFDKTGTVTEGRFRVLEGLEHLLHDDAILLKNLTSNSIHPISRAIHSALSEVEAVPSTNQVSEYAGRGLRSGAYSLGSKRFMQELNVQLLEQEKSVTANAGNSTVYFAKGSKLLAKIKLGDQVRPEIPGILKELGDVSTWLVSGDAKDVVAVTAKNCGFKHWRGENNPLQKRELVESLKRKGKIISMIGDGINDAPALSASHVGISVASATDTSIQISDILLTSSSLATIPHLVKAGRLCHQRIHQNLAWAFSYNIIGIALAASGNLTPLYAAGAMVFSSITVIVNSLRRYS